MRLLAALQATERSTTGRTCSPRKNRWGNQEILGEEEQRWAGKKGMDTEEWVTHRGPAHLSSPLILNRQANPGLLLEFSWDLGPGTWPLSTQPPTLTPCGAFKSGPKVSQTAASPHTSSNSLRRQGIKRKAGNPDSHNSLSPKAHAPGMITSDHLTWVRARQDPVDSGVAETRCKDKLGLQLSDVHCFDFPADFILYPDALYSCRSLKL